LLIEKNNKKMEMELRCLEGEKRLIEGEIDFQKIIYSCPMNNAGWGRKRYGGNCDAVISISTPGLGFHQWVPEFIEDLLGCKIVLPYNYKNKNGIRRLQCVNEGKKICIQYSNNYLRPKQPQKQPRVKYGKPEQRGSYYKNPFSNPRTTDKKGRPNTPRHSYPGW